MGTMMLLESNIYGRMRVIEGIILDKNNIGIPDYILLLNSLFVLEKIRPTDKPSEYRDNKKFPAELLSSPEHEVIGILSVNEMIYVSWYLKHETVISSPIT